MPFLCCNILGRVGIGVCVYYRFDLGPWLSSLFIVPAVCDSNELQSWLRQRVPDINFHCPLHLL